MAELSDAGTRYEVVIDDVGFMLAGLMTRVDVTNLMPRVSVATDQKEYHDLGELETFGQSSFHHGRGQLYMADPEAVFDSDLMDLRYPGKAFPALQKTQAGSTFTNENIIAITPYAKHNSVADTVWVLAVGDVATTEKFYAESTGNADDGFLTKYDDDDYAQCRAATPTVDTDDSYTYVGQRKHTGAFNIWRGYHSVDTSPIPDAATLNWAKWVAYVVDYSDTDFTLELRQDTWSDSGLEAGDWSADPNSDALMATKATSTMDTGWTEITLNTSLISKTARTEFYSISYEDRSASEPTGLEYVQMIAAEEGGDNIPYIEVNYTRSGGGVLYYWDNTNSSWTSETTGLTKAACMEQHGDDLYIGQGADHDARFYDAVGIESGDGTNCTTTDTTLQDTDEAWATNEWTGQLVTCNAKTMTVTQNNADTLTGSAWSGGGNPGNDEAWTIDYSRWEDAVDCKADHLKSHDGVLWRSLDSALYFSVNPDAASPTWSEVTLGAEAPITGLDVYSNLLVVNRENGVWQVEKDPVGNYRAFRPINLAAAKSPNNGRAHTVYKERLYYSEESGITEFDGFSVQAMGTNRFDRDPTAGTDHSTYHKDRGPVVSLTQDSDFLWALVFPDDVSGSVSVMVFNGLGWCRYQKGPATEVGETGVIHWQPPLQGTGVLSKYTIWFSTGEKMYYIQFPEGTADPSGSIGAGSSYETTSYLYTSWYDPLPDVCKEWMRLLTDFDCQDNTKTHTLVPAWQEEGWQINHWHRFEYVTSTGVHEINLRRYDTWNLNSALSRRIRFRFGFVTDGTISQWPPLLLMWATRYVHKPTPRLGWTIPVKLYEEVELLDGSIEGAPPTIRRNKVLELAGTNPHKLNDGSPPLAGTNLLTNPSFEPPIDENCVPRNWEWIAGWVRTHPGRAPVAHPGSYEVRLSSSGHIKSDVFAASGRIRVGVYVRKYSGTAVGRLELWDEDNSQVVAYADSTGTYDYERISLVRPTSGNYRVRVKHQSGTGDVIFDCAEALTGAETEETPYVDGDQPRCYWTGSPQNSTSIRRAHYVAHITGFTEAFRFGEQAAEGDITQESQVTFTIREAA